MQLFARKRAYQANNLNSSPLTIENGNSIYVYAIKIFQSDQGTSAVGDIVTISTSVGSETIITAILPEHGQIPAGADTLLFDIPFLADKGLVLSCDTDDVGVSIFYSQVD